MKLLDRTLRTYLLYSIVVMLISTPVFYIVIGRLFTEEIDEVLWLRKEAIESHLSRFASEQALLNWRDLEGNTRLLPITPKTPLHNRIYDVEYREHPNNPKSESEPFRELSARLSFRGQQFQLITRTSLLERKDLLRAVALTLTGLLILLLSGFLLLNRRIARRLWQPFYATLAQLRQYRVEQDEPLRLAASKTTEFAELNQTLNELTLRSHQTYADQKEFTENAAHEMQTPVAIFQSKLERLSQTQPLTHEQAGLIGSLNSVTARLARLNKSLLLLSRIENRQFTDVEPVDVASLTDALVNQSAELIQNRELQTERTGLTNGPVLNTNRTLLEILLANLLGNAIRYTRPSGRIMIDIQADGLTLSNTGKPLAIPADRLFTRFQKGDSQVGSVGLGLAIAQSVADTSGYILTYQYEAGSHRFSLRFAGS